MCIGVFALPSAARRRPPSPAYIPDHHRGKDVDAKAHAQAFYNDMQARGLNAHRAAVVRLSVASVAVVRPHRSLYPHPRCFTYIHTYPQVDAVASKTAIFVPDVYDAMSYETYKVSHHQARRFLPPFILHQASHTTERPRSNHQTHRRSMRRSSPSTPPRSTPPARASLPGQPRRPRRPPTKWAAICPSVCTLTEA